MANIVSQIADKVRPIGVSTNYGEPVEVGDQTLIPVSLGWFGFGGGGDGDDNGGGGGGGVSIPVGHLAARGQHPDHLGDRQGARQGGPRTQEMTTGRTGGSWRRRHGPPVRHLVVTRLDCCHTHGSPGPPG
ncbi:hypothetical protein [Curtobacterium sp. Csp1]|uniref:hypothetical protein n=1 Tax=Curtobacterium sp. Csp1 TaxID=2495429 RepID=UPI0034A0AF70